MRTWWLAAIAALVVFAVAPPVALAQTSLAPTAVGIGVPPAAQLGQVVTLQARLVGVGGVPVARATVYFTSPTKFLNVSGDAVIAEAVTDAEGLATATWHATRSGTLTIQAEFRGNNTYAPSRAMTPMAITGEQQLYVQQAGVRIPGLNWAPVAGVPVLSGLWPALSAWPIAAALLVVWSLYATVAVLLYRVAAAGDTSSTAAQ